MKKYLLLAVVVTLFASGSYVAEKSFITPPIPAPTVFETPSGESPEVKPPEIEVKPQSQPSARTPQTRTATTTNAPKAVYSPAPNFTLSVAGSSYAAFAPSGSTVFNAMKVLASTSDFAFTGKDYPSLGFFVESVNGQKAESGHNWILYVNGTLSGTGASQTTLKAGDAIEWRYEKNY